MEKLYLIILREASKDKMLKFEELSIWKSILTYNKYEIQTEAEYLERLSLSPSRMIKT